MDWVQVNEDGFGYPPDMSMERQTTLFTFGGQLFANHYKGLFRMDDPFKKAWTKVFHQPQFFIPFGKYLYRYDNNELWWIEAGTEFVNTNWKQVYSIGLPGDVSPQPMTIFNGQIYGVYGYKDSSSNERVFGIWRSKDIGATIMNWQFVVANSFGDPKNNQGVDFMSVFNGHLYAGTTTLKVGGTFGNPADYGDGVEIWESSSGDQGTWAQINVDGFGTESQSYSGNKFRTNQVIGSWVVYEAPNEAREYLFVGTKSHFGAEIWRYDGKGKGGWTNVTPQWAGVGPFKGPGRNESMAVFNANLYLAEGFPTANLAKYDGNSWSIVKSGPNPFAPEDGGLASLAVLTDRIYVTTEHAFGSGTTRGDQVYGVWGVLFLDADNSLPAQLKQFTAVSLVGKYFTPSADINIAISAGLVVAHAVVKADQSGSFHWGSLVRRLSVNSEVDAVARDLTSGKEVTASAEVRGPGE